MIDYIESKFMCYDLIDYCNNGNLAMVKSMIDRGACIDAVDIDGQTLLQCAYRNFHILEYLISKGVPINKLSDSKQSVLGYCIGDGLTDTANYLISQGATIGPGDILYADKIDQVKQLLAHGADINYSERYGYTILHCCSIKDLKLIKFLIYSGANIYAKDMYDRDFIYIAKKSNNDAVKRFISDYIETNNIYIACVKGDIEAIKNRFIHLYHPLDKDELGNTPIYYAKTRGHQEIYEYLVRYNENNHL